MYRVFFSLNHKNRFCVPMQRRWTFTGLCRLLLPLSLTFECWKNALLFWARRISTKICNKKCVHYISSNINILSVNISIIFPSARPGSSKRTNIEIEPYFWMKTYIRFVEWKRDWSWHNSRTSADDLLEVRVCFTSDVKSCHQHRSGDLWKHVCPSPRRHPRDDSQLLGLGFCYAGKY